MYQPSEMAILMNAMYAYNLQLKQQIANGEVPANMPLDLMKLHTAEMSNGHARTDRGAPLYLRRAAPETPYLSVGLLELDEGAADRVDLYDFVIFTEIHDREDPCVAFLKSRQKQ